jgi:hypothetical protein
MTAALLGGCESGWQLEGYVVPEPGVNLERQLVVLLATEVELNLGMPSPDGFTKRARVLAVADKMTAKGVRFQFFDFGCTYEKFQVVAIAPKARIALHNDVSKGGPSASEPVTLRTGDYLARTPLLDVTDCGWRGTQRLTVPLSATEWAPAPPAP